MKTVMNFVKNHKVIFGVLGVAVNCAGIYSVYRIGRHQGEQSGAQAMLSAAAMYHPEFPKEFMDFMNSKQEAKSKKKNKE